LFCAQRGTIGVGVAGRNETVTKLYAGTQLIAGQLPDYRPSSQEMLFDWQEASFDLPIAADSSPFVIPAL
jgi:hypothetical protein